MSKKGTSLRTVSSLRFFINCVNGRHHFFLTGLSITRAIQTLVPEDEKVARTMSRRVAGIWFIGLSGLFGLFGATSERDQTDPRTR